ncbi:MAG: hypothetical protein ACRD96_09350 [Bryobacteraceae bacterium]
MRILLLALVLAAQAGLKVEQLTAFVESSIKLRHPDRQVASYLQKITLLERLDDRTIEDLQGKGAGPRTVEALRLLRDKAQNLPAPAPKTVRLTPVIPAPSAEEQRRLIDEAREYALNYSKNLPNFICTQVTRRYFDPSGLEFWQSDDVLTSQLSYFEEKESYKLVLVNNLPTERKYESLGGASSTGEFGSMLKQIFEVESQGRFQWERWATLRGRRAYVFGYRIPQIHSRWRIHYRSGPGTGQEIIAGYSGLVYIDKETGKVLRVTLEAQDIPATFPIRQASTMLDYDYTAISEQTHLLPLKAVVRMRQDKFLTRNDVEFRMYRRFGSDVTITFTPDALPEDKEQK